MLPRPGQQPVFAKLSASATHGGWEGTMLFLAVRERKSRKPLFFWALPPTSSHNCLSSDFTAVNITINTSVFRHSAHPSRELASLRVVLVAFGP